MTTKQTVPAMAPVGRERWSVWCEHTDGRHYRMGDASETRWSQETAERVAKHMTTYEVGAFIAQPCPSPTDFERTRGGRRDDRMTVNAVLDGVKRMLERMSVHDAPSDPKEARGHKLALASAVNALCRGEWQR